MLITNLNNIAYQGILKNIVYLIPYNQVYVNHQNS
jgi:hypothetical protein